MLIFSRYGDIPLGRDGEKPEFPLMSWFAMLFCAGMGIGLVFWGQPSRAPHFYHPPFGSPETPEAASFALQYSFFHWGLHPWAMYAMVALCLAYFQFRKQEPGLISASCQLLIQGQTRRSVGHAIDIIAVFATVFGVATSLGFGAIQISGGLSYLFEIPNTVMTQLVLIAVVTALYLLSAQTGLQRGIKYLSHVNMVLAIALMGFLLFLGPTTFIMEVFTSALGDYLHNLPKMSLYLAPFDDSRWIQKLDALFTGPGGLPGLRLSERLSPEFLEVGPFVNLCSGCYSSRHCFAHCGFQYLEERPFRLTCSSTQDSSRSLKRKGKKWRSLRCWSNSLWEPVCL